MKKIRFYVLLVAILSLVLVGCGNTQTTTVKKEVTEVASLKTDQNVMVFSALSGANALSSTVTNLALSDSIGEEELPEIDMEKANSYLLMMENILADGGPVVTTEAASDREGYDMMMVITVKDLAGNTSSYTIYYSIVVEEEVLPEEETTTPEVEEQPETEETTPETEDTTTDENAEAPLAGKFGGNNHGYHDQDDREDREEPKHEHHDKAYDQFKHHHHGDKEDEVEYDINALAVIDGVEYEVSGKKEVEEDDEEVEIKFIIKLDDENYVKVEQEIEEDEVEYKYDVFKGRRMVSSLKFESEEEDGKTFVKLSTTNESGDRETYKFIKDEDVTIVKYECKGYSYTLMVKASVDAEGNIVYDYKVKEREGFNWNHKKGPKGEHREDYKQQPEGEQNV